MSEILIKPIKEKEKKIKEKIIKEKVIKEKIKNVKLLNDLYYVNMNFDGYENLYQKAKEINNDVTISEVKDFLKNQNTTQQTITEIGKKEYKPIYSYSYYSFQIDLTFLPQYKKQNKDNYVLFTAININTRFSYAYFSKNKETSTIIKFLNLFLHHALIIDDITLDSGSEFTNNIVMKWFHDQNIKLYFVVGESHKLGIINRFHRTLKEKLLKYFIATQQLTWIDVIDEIIKNYNNTKNRTTGFTPAFASKGLVQSVIIKNAEYKTFDIEENEPIKMDNLGEYCRIKIKKGIFDKSSIKYSSEIYKIISISKSSVIVELNDIKKTVKKTDIIIVNNDFIKEEFPIMEQIEENKKVNRVEKKLKQLEAKPEAIRTSARIRQSNQQFKDYV